MLRGPVSAGKGAEYHATSLTGRPAGLRVAVAHESTFTGTARGETPAGLVSSGLADRRVGTGAKHQTHTHTQAQRLCGSGFALVADGAETRGTRRYPAKYPRCPSFVSRSSPSWAPSSELGRVGDIPSTDSTTWTQQVSQESCDVFPPAEAAPAFNISPRRSRTHPSHPIPSHACLQPACLPASVAGMTRTNRRDNPCLLGPVLSGKLAASFFSSSLSLGITSSLARGSP